MTQTTSAQDARAALDLRTLRSSFSGALLTEADGAAYNEARAIFNAMFDRRPTVIARATSAADVAAAIAFGRRHDLRIAVRAGGHSVAGYSAVDGGLVIDLRPMNRIEVFPECRTARVQAGVNWGELDAATQEHGLATTGGRMTTTGVAGFTLGSGSGWLERLHGLAADNLLSAEVVTAGGEVLTASEHENADLFWGLRGGGGNFGVVTEFEFRLHPVGPTIYAGLVMHPRDRAPEVLRSFRDFMDAAPREVCGGAVLMTAPPAPFVPAELQGQPAVALLAAYIGSVDAGAASLAPLHEIGAPAFDGLEPMPYRQFQAITDQGNPPGRRNYWRSGVLPELPADAIDSAIAGASGASSPTSVIVLARAGGAIADTPEEATPLGGRSANWLYHCYGIWTDTDDDRHIAWVRSVEAAMRPWTASGMALNFFSAVDHDLVRSTFGDKYQRLVAVKDRYDPGNVFRMNQNVMPSSST